MALLPNQDDVLHRSGVAGIDVNFVYRIPDEAKVATSGNAGYRVGDYGLWVGNSGTTGDTAQIQSMRLNVLTDFSKVISVFDLWVLESPVTDDVEVGSIDGSGVNADSGAYFDLTAEQYHVGATTKAATIPSAYTNTRLVIEEDFVNHETTFTQSARSTGVNESVTFGTVNSGNDRIVSYNSNSNSERSPTITRFRRVFMP